MAASERFGALRERIGPVVELRVPTLLLGILVSLGTWGTYIAYPTAGIDSSWGAGLYLATENGLSFGPDIAWTYGPLGFLNIPVNWDTDLTTLSFVFLAALHTALACGAVWSLRRALGAVPAAMITFGALALLPLIEVAFPVAALLCFMALRPERPRWSVLVLIVGGALLGALLTLVKLSIGPPIVAMFGFALIGARARTWQVALYVALFVGAFLTLWLLSGENLGNLGDYVRNGREIISGYSEAMIVSDGTPAQSTGALVAAVATALAFTAGAGFACYRDERARLFGVLVAAAVGFAIFKEGVVRMDTPHLAIYFGTVVTLWLTLSWAPQRRRVLVAGLVVFGAVSVPATLAARGGSVFDDLNFVARTKGALTQFDLVLSPRERSDTTLFAQAFLQQDYDIDPSLLAELEGRSVSVEPFEIGAIFAYDLDWAPLPVIQGYSAYTSALDELNAAEAASPTGPERILRGVPPADDGEDEPLTIDARVAGWDPPAQARAELCNFVPLETTGTWQVLGRVPDRCSEPEPLGSVEAAYGETVDVPTADRGEVVFVRIDGAEVSGLESLRTLLYRAEFRYAIVDEDEYYRVVPGTTADGLMLQGDPSIVGRGQFAQAPQAETLTLTGPSGDLRYDFFSMAVEGESNGSTVPGAEG